MARAGRVNRVDEERLQELRKIPVPIKPIDSCMTEVSLRQDVSVWTSGGNAVAEKAV